MSGISWRHFISGSILFCYVYIGCGQWFTNEHWDEHFFRNLRLKGFGAECMHYAPLIYDSLHKLDFWTSVTNVIAPIPLLEMGNKGELFKSTMLYCIYSLIDIYRILIDESQLFCLRQAEIADQVITCPIALSIGFTRWTIFDAREEIAIQFISIQFDLFTNVKYRNVKPS